MLNFLIRQFNIYWFFISLVILITISFLSLQPLNNLPTVAGTDKTHHVIAYLFLMLPIALKKPKYWYLIIVFFAVWGGIIELIQPYVNRYGEWLDMLANVSGLILGTLIGFLIRFYYFKKKQKVNGASDGF